jgi:hypothetical protein
MKTINLLGILIVSLGITAGSLYAQSLSINTCTDQKNTLKINLFNLSAMRSNLQNVKEQIEQQELIVNVENAQMNAAGC